MAELEKTFKTFFHTFYPILTVFAERYVGDSDVANDMAQEAFIKLWKSELRFIDNNARKAYLYTITKNSCLNYLKHKKIEQKYQVECVESELFFRDQVIEQETFMLIRKAVSELPKQAKKVIEFSLNGLQNPEIAIRMNISVNTVKSLKTNGYRLLRQNLKEHAILMLTVLMYK